MTMQTYDTAKITVSPTALNTTYNTVSGLATDVANTFQSINTALNSLQLSWAGSASDAMQSISQRWQDAADDLFGTKSDPNRGVLVRLLSGIQAAGQNYDNAENWSITNFGQLATNLMSGAGSGPSAPTSVTNSSLSTPTTFITETF